MAKSDIDIDHVAKLANLELTQDEKKDLKKQLLRILAYVEQINSAEITDKNLPKIGITESVTREDKKGQSLSQGEALSNAKLTKNGYFATKGIFNNEDS